MHVDLSEPITIDDLARAAMYSKFHFTRVFERETGISPGRFLSAVRIAEAKRLLQTTTRTVTEISHEVGWSSVGSFSSRFSASVCVPPSEYRRGTAAPPLSAVLPAARSDPRHAVRGQVRVVAPGRVTARVFVGLFSDRVPQGRPAAHVVLSSPQAYALPAPPAGRWYVVACALPPEAGRVKGVVVESMTGVLVGTVGPATIGPRSPVVQLDVDLREPHLHDPPLLVSLGHLPQSLPIAARDDATGRQVPSPRDQSFDANSLPWGPRPTGHPARADRRPLPSNVPSRMVR
jgi:AraC-like DNA-binding protein